jgi:hypothetical protein
MIKYLDLRIFLGVTNRGRGATEGLDTRHAHNRQRERKMRAVMTAAFAAAAIGLGATSLSAAPAGGAVVPNATPPTLLVQDNYHGSYTTGWGWGYGYNFIPACPTNYHYTCWPDPYGYRHCGCIVNARWW